jgi:hypothetical protein
MLTVVETVIVDWPLPLGHHTFISCAAPTTAGSKLNAISS